MGDITMDRPTDGLIGVQYVAGAPATGHAQMRAGGGLALTGGGDSSNAAVYGEVAGGMSDTLAVVGRIGVASSVTIGGGPQFYTGRDEMRPYGQFLVGYTRFDGGGATSYSPGGGGGGHCPRRRQDANGVHRDGGRVARAGQLASDGRPGAGWETRRGPESGAVTATAPAVYIDADDEEYPEQKPRRDRRRPYNRVPTDGDRRSRTAATSVGASTGFVRVRLSAGSVRIDPAHLRPGPAGQVRCNATCGDHGGSAHRSLDRGGSGVHAGAPPSRSRWKQRPEPHEKSCRTAWPSAGGRPMNTRAMTAAAAQAPRVVSPETTRSAAA